MLLDELHAGRHAILALADSFGFDDIRVFGSVARGEETAESDIDLLFKPRPGTNAFYLVRFKRALEENLGREVDIVSENGLFWYSKDEILNSAKAL